ncbi:MAG: hypothetical protein HKN28_16605 [Alphaproteobacteria bacterium]|nr:hypothetical protein [Alphaproteobacteria bacterium]
MTTGSPNLSLEEFTAALDNSTPPDGLDNALQALWYEARSSGPGATLPRKSIDDAMSDDWNRAHELVQRLRDERGRWVHGYLHRVEGDDDNARGWYKRAEQPFPTLSLADEWAQIAVALLAR